MKIKIFTFNAFQENTYLVFDEENNAIIIDPGCSSPDERKILSDYISSNGLVPRRLLNTHCHIDHVLGNEYVASRYNLKLETHRGEKKVLEMCEMVSNMYGLPYEKSPEIECFIEEGDFIECGTMKFQVLNTPGHSPASISFFNEDEKVLIAGDVLFRESIGRTDLPGGDYNTLISSIKTKYFPLGEDVIVYPGHGPSTTISHERSNNPFLK